ncbi:MAG: FAD-dependent oxidoreductase, partial [Chloroflexota bacterium]
MALLRGRTSWDKEAEVVVIGYGSAGAAAAITAVENGAEALLIEKQPKETHHTNTSMSGGAVFTPPDAKSALEYMAALCGVTGKEGTSWTDRAALSAWAEYAATGKQWIEERGGEIFLNTGGVEFPELSRGAFLPHYRFKGMGIGLARFLDGQVRTKGIEVLYDTRAGCLITNRRGRVVGVEVGAGQNGKRRKL